jgi:hypothetical protein
LQLSARLDCQRVSASDKLAVDSRSRSGPRSDISTARAADAKRPPSDDEPMAITARNRGASKRARPLHETDQPPAFDAWKASKCHIILGKLHKPALSCSTEPR